MKRMRNRLPAFLLAGAMTIGMGMGALADYTDPTPTTDPETTATTDLAHAYLVKNFTMAPNVTCPSETFTFTFTKVGVNEDDAADTYTPVMPVLPATTAAQTGITVTDNTLNIAYTDADTAAAASTNLLKADGTTNFDAAGDAYRLKGVSLAQILGYVDVDGDGVADTADNDNLAGVFTHAGEYVYTVTETTGTNTDVTYSTATYKLRVFVVNDDSVDNVGTDRDGLKISGITIMQTHEEYDWASETAFVNVKVDATTEEKDEGTDDTTDTKTNQGTGFTFQNEYTPKSSLNILKTVKGSYGDQTKLFPFAMTLTIPDSMKAAQQKMAGVAVTATVFDADGNAVQVPGATEGATVDKTVTFTFDADGKTASAIFTLAHGQKLNFDKTLPVGTTYTLGEYLDLNENVFGTGTTTTQNWYDAGATVAEEYSDYTAKAERVTTNAETDVTVGVAGTKGATYVLTSTTPAQPTDTITQAMAAAMVVGENDKVTTAGAATEAVNTTEATDHDFLSNVTEVSNTYDNITITGLLMNNLPFILMILIALSGITGYVVVKRKMAR